MRGDRQTLELLVAETDVQAETIREQAAALAHYKKIFDRASAQAKIGVWECSLPDETLFWTDGTYDLFELPPGSPLRRAEILKFYDADSLRCLDALRTAAIEEHGGFNLETLIKTAKGNEKWIRITADVECENGRPVRIFGMKQDITAEKALRDRLRLLADCDPLTGLANRGLLQRRLGGGPECGTGQTPVGALVLVDLDGFKQVNDTFGHLAGDACLMEVAARLREVCRNDELVARLGGDEFAVVMNGPTSRAAAERVGARILAALRRPIDWNAQIFRLSGSVGIALAPSRTASDPSLLFSEADLALYAAKEAGKNAARIFSAELGTTSGARLRA